MKREKTYTPPQTLATYVSITGMLAVSGPGGGDITPPDVDGNDSGQDPDDNTDPAKPYNYDLWSEEENSELPVWNYEL